MSTFKVIAVAVLVLISTVAWGDEWTTREATSGYSVNFNVEADDGTVRTFKPVVACKELVSGYEKREWTLEEWEAYRDELNTSDAMSWYAPQYEFGYERTEIVEEVCQLTWKYVGVAE